MGGGGGFEAENEVTFGEATNVGPSTGKTSPGRGNSIEQGTEQGQKGNDSKQASENLYKEAEQTQKQNGGQDNKTYGPQRVEQPPFQDNKGNSIKVLTEGDRAFVPDGNGKFQEFQAKRGEDGKIQALFPTDKQSQQEPIYAKDYKPSNLQDGQKQSTDNKQGTNLDANKGEQPSASKGLTGAERISTGSEKPDSKDKKSNIIDVEHAEHSRPQSQNKVSDQPHNAEQAGQTEQSKSKAADQVMNRTSIISGDQARSAESSFQKQRNESQADAVIERSPEKSMNRQSLNEALNNQTALSAETRKFANGPVQNGLEGEYKTVPARDYAMSKEGAEQSKAQWTDRKDVIEQTSSGKVSSDRADVIEQTSGGKNAGLSLDGKGGIVIPARSGGSGAGGAGNSDGGIGKTPISKPGEPGKSGGSGGVGGGGSRGDRNEGTRDGKPERGEKGEPGKTGRKDNEAGKSDSGKSDGAKSDRGEKNGDSGRDDKGNRADKQEPGGKDGRADHDPGKGDREPGKGIRDGKDQGGKIEPSGKSGGADNKPDKGERVVDAKPKGPEKRFPLDPVLTAKIQILSALPPESRRLISNMVGKLSDKQDPLTNLRNSKEGKILNQLQELNLSKEQLTALRKYLDQPKSFPFEFTKFDERTQKKFAEIIKDLIGLSKDHARNASTEKVAPRDAAVQKSNVDQTSTKPLAQPKDSNTRTVIQKPSEPAAIIDSLNKVARQADTATRPVDTPGKQSETVTRPVANRDDHREVTTEQKASKKQDQTIVQGEQPALAAPSKSKDDRAQLQPELHEDDQSDTVVSAEAEDVFSAVFRNAVPKPGEAEDEADEEAEKSKLENEELEREKVEARIVVERNKKNNPKTRQHYKVKEGDSINSIAREFLQDESYAVVIYHHNKTTSRSAGKGKQAKFEIPLRELNGQTCAVPLIGSQIMIPTPARAKEFFKLPGAQKYYAHIDFEAKAEDAERV